MDMTNETKEAAEQQQQQRRDTQRVNLQLPMQIVKIIEAAVTLGDSESIEAFITEAATVKANAFQHKVRSLFGNAHAEQASSDTKVDRRRGPRKQAADVASAGTPTTPAVAAVAARNGHGD